MASAGVWSVALIGTAVIPVALIFQPSLNTIKLLALWLGLTGSVAWIAGVSLVQMVPAQQKGWSNGLMMASLGVGSIGGAVTGRGLLYHADVDRIDELRRRCFLPAAAVWFHVDGDYPRRR